MNTSHAEEEFLTSSHPGEDTSSERSSSKKKTIIIILVLIVVIALGLGLGLGLGLKKHSSSFQTLQIKTCDDLSKISGDGNYTLMGDIDCNGTILSYIDSMKGTFNGQGHTIKNFVAPVHVDDDDVCIAFLEKFEGNASNVNFAEVNITGDLTKYASKNIRIGGFACKIEKSRVNSISINTVISLTLPASSNEESSYCHIGGFVGMIEDNNSFQDITSVVDITISGANSNSIIGGLVGSQEDTSTYQNIKTSGTVVGAGYSTIGGIGGKLSGTLQSSSSSCSINSTKGGGLIGMTNKASVISSFFEGKLNVQTQTLADFFGGIVGMGDQVYIQQSQFKGIFNIQSSDASYCIGGLVGKSTSANFDHSSAMANILPKNGSGIGGLIGSSSVVGVAYSTFNGNISGRNSVGGFIGGAEHVSLNNSAFNGNITANNNPSYVGGFAGSVVATIGIFYSNNSGIITTANAGIYVGGMVGDVPKGETHYSHSKITIDGKINVGGLVGNSDKYFLVEQSYYNGKISATSSAAANIGGLIGHVNGTSEYNESFSEGSISSSGINIGGIAGTLANQSHNILVNSYSTMSLSGSKYLGGLVGFNDAGNLTQVSLCFSTGKVDCDSDTAGGMIGGKSNPPRVTSSYWDKNTSGKRDSNGGTRLSNREMRKEKNFNGWDFSKIWLLNSDIGHPTLRNITP